MEKTIKQQLMLILLVIIGSLGTVLPLLQPGYFPMHDDTQVARVIGMADSLEDGMFPVRWVQNLGYGFGYPIFNFYAPLAYYVGGVFHLVGFEAVTATKMMFGLGMLLSGVAMFYLARQFWGNAGAVVAALLYTYAPYHGINLYVRGAIAELWAYAFLPFIFYGMWCLYSSGKWRYGLIAALGLAGVILSHNLTAFMIVPVVGIASILLIIASWRRKKKTGGLVVVSLLLGVALSAFYWLPALAEMSYTDVSSVLGGGSDPVDHLLCPQQLWSSHIGFGGSGPGCIDGMSFVLGKIHILFTLLSLVVLGLTLHHSKRITGVMLFSLWVFLMAVLLMLPLAQPFWESVRLMQYIQFPWRYLSLALLAGSFLSGSVVWYLSSRFLARDSVIVSGLVMLLAAGIMLLYLKYFTPQMIIQTTSPLSDTRNIFWQYSRISDEYLPPNFLVPANPDKLPKQRVEVISGDGKVSSLQVQTDEVHARVTITSENARLALHTAYFPSWKLFLNGKLHPMQVKNGRLFTQLPQGEHTLKLRFIHTPVQKIGNVISAAGLFLIIAGIIRGRKRHSL